MRTGEILCRDCPKYIKWKIGDFTSIFKKRDLIKSPTFPFDDAEWCLRFCTDSVFRHSAYTSACLIRERAHNLEHCISGRIGVKRDDGTVYVSHTFDQQHVNNANDYILFVNFVKVSALKRDMSEIAPRDEVIFFCWMSNEGCREMETQTELEAVTWQTRMSQLYDTKENADVRFVVNGKILLAHRLVLAVRSPEISRILTSSDAVVYTHVIDTESVTEAAFDILLRFLYTDTLGTTDKHSIVEAYRCALEYQVADLQNKCKEEMQAWDIPTKEIFTLMDCGLDIPTLRNKCVHLLRREGREAIFDPSFLEISSRCLRFILENSVLENVPLLERMDRIIEWCIHPDAEDPDYAGVRNKLLDGSSTPLLGRLEFENLDLKELTLVLNKYQGLITPDELVCFLKYKHAKDESVLPVWCLRVSRGAS